MFISVWDRFWKPLWLVWESTFGALGVQQVSNMSSKVHVKVGIEKSRFGVGPSMKKCTGLVARGRGFGRKEEKKKRRKKERKEHLKT